MNPFDAIQYLNEITGKLVGDRDMHIRIQMAINVLANYVQNSAPTAPPTDAEIIPFEGASES